MATRSVPGLFRHGERLVEIQCARIASAFQRLAGTGPSTRMRRITCAQTPKKWAPALPVRVRGIHQPQVRLVHQRGCLQRVARPFVGHVAPRQTMQLIVYQRHKLLDRALVPLAPGLQQLRDLLWGWLHLFSRAAIRA